MAARTNLALIFSSKGKCMPNLPEYIVPGSALHPGGCCKVVFDIAAFYLPDWPEYCPRACAASCGSAVHSVLTFNVRCCEGTEQTPSKAACWLFLTAVINVNQVNLDSTQASHAAGAAARCPPADVRGQSGARRVRHRESELVPQLVRERGQSSKAN